jgi:hypothetical protein
MREVLPTGAGTDMRVHIRILNEGPGMVKTSARGQYPGERKLKPFSRYNNLHHIIILIIGDLKFKEKPSYE